MALAPTTIAIFGPILVLLLVHQLGRVHHAPIGWTMTSLAYGAASFYMALRLNTAVFHASGWSQATIVNYVAPLIEEVLKAALVFYLLRTKRIDHATTCLWYGFCVGIGFSLIENIFYVSLGAGVEPSLIRVGSTTLMHASSTALIGLAILRARHPHEHHHGWIDRHPHIAAARAILMVALRIGLLRVAVKGVVLKGVLLRSIASGERRHATFNVLVDRPIALGVILSAVGLGLVFLTSMLVTTRRLSKTELAVLPARSWH